MSTLHDKLAKLQARQAEIERQIAIKATAENAVIASAFAIILSTSSNAHRLAQTCPKLASMSTRDRSLFDSWLSRIEPPAPAQNLGSTETQSERQQ